MRNAGRGRRPRPASEGGGRRPAKRPTASRGKRGRRAVTDGGDWIRLPAQRTVAVNVEGRRYEIPVDRDGFVTEQSIAARFAAVSEGNRKGNGRSMSRDLDKTATVTRKLGDRIRPEDIAEWWAHPNESDIIGIDDEKTQIFSTEGATRKSSLPYQRKIGVVGTPSERKMVRKTLDACFTTAELKEIAGNGSVYAFALTGRRRLGPHANGYYDPRDGTIVIKRGATPGTVVHESVHKLRHTRSGGEKYTSSQIDAMMSEKDPYQKEFLRALEEGATECETVARLSPFKINGRRTSYYGAIAKTEDEALRMIGEDRRTLVGNSDPDAKGLRGKKAVDSVDRNLRKTNISGYVTKVAKELKEKRSNGRKP